MRSKGVDIHDINLVHANVEFFKDVIEIHFRPRQMFYPYTDKILGKFFKEQGKIQFQLYDENVGYAHPSHYFNLVFNLLHINRHVFGEGIILRQVMYYYYILKALDKVVRKEVISMLKKLRLAKFTAALMILWMVVILESLESIYVPQPMNKGSKGALII